MNGGLAFSPSSRDSPGSETSPSYTLSTTNRQNPRSSAANFLLSWLFCRDRLLQRFYAVTGVFGGEHANFDLLLHRDQFFHIGWLTRGGLQKSAQVHPPQQALELLFDQVAHILIFVDAHHPGHIRVVQPVERRDGNRAVCKRRAQPRSRAPALVVGQAGGGEGGSQRIAQPQRIKKPG